jgi:hypothetical protein
MLMPKDMSMSKFIFMLKFMSILFYIYGTYACTHIVPVLVHVYDYGYTVGSMELAPSISNAILDKLLK